ncbi:MAG: hypothetical protein M2R45_00720 [Verrucomicrobia subdivision 3 bacterium]|nr:hypothetical protein [Limisphaerales bacterium]MCS1414397.1 hypothetical protein [Limisphaerales bacterium]
MQSLGFLRLRMGFVHRDGDPNVVDSDIFEILRIETFDATVVSGVTMLRSNRFLLLPGSGGSS